MRDADAEDEQRERPGDEDELNGKQRALATRDRDTALAELASSNGLEVDYVEVADFDPPVLAGAVRVGSIRLIDNVPLEGDTE